MHTFHKVNLGLCSVVQGNYMVQAPDDPKSTLTLVRFGPENRTNKFITVQSRTKGCGTGCTGKVTTFTNLFVQA